jgi:hypothetical protein
MNANSPEQKTDKKDWQFYNLRKQRAVIEEQVNALNIPEFVKAFVMADVDGLPADCIGVEINGYGITHETPHAITRSINITVVGIRL